MSYTVFSLVGVLISLRSVARYVSFTQASIAYSHLGLYAFFTMVIFGSMYYIVPRLIGREWRYASLIKLHFWASAYGIGLMTLMLLAGGLTQGASMENPSLAFSESVESVLPYLRGRSLSGILLTVSHFIFAYHFGLMLFGWVANRPCPHFLTQLKRRGPNRTDERTRPSFPRNLRDVCVLLGGIDGNPKLANRTSQSSI
jgi:cytochrome c oxidase cbb3-type subunit 1